MINSKGGFRDIRDTPIHPGDTFSVLRFQFLRYNGEGNKPNCLIFGLYIINLLHRYWQISCNSACKVLRSNDLSVKFT